MLQFKAWMENNTWDTSNSVISILSIRGYTSGQHAYGPNDKEISAKNPMKYADWHFDIESKEVETLLLGKKGAILDSSGGSYHEQWLTINAYVDVSEDLDLQDKLAELDIHTERLNKHVLRRAKIYNFTFKGVRQLAEHIERQYGGIRNAVKSGEDRDAYWARMIKKAGGDISNPLDTYNPGDDYYKK